MNLLGQLWSLAYNCTLTSESQLISISFLSLPIILSNPSVVMSAGKNRASRISSEAAGPILDNSDTSSKILVNTGTAKFSIKIPEPDRHDLIAELSLPSCFGNGKNKTAILLRFVAIRKNVVSRFGQGNDELTLALNDLIPVDAPSAKKLKVSDTAACLVDLYDIIRMAMQDAATVSTTAFTSAFESLEKAYEEALTKATNKQRAGVSKIVVKASSEEIRRMFLKDGGTQPTDETYKKCPFCKHSYVDEPPSNRTNDVENRKLMSDWRVKKITFEENLAKGVKTFGAKGKEISRAPTKPDLKINYFHCHCAQFRRLHALNNYGSTCPINCIDEKTGKQFPFKQGKNTCHLCSCPCGLCFTVSSFFFKSYVYVC